ncbi:helix-turn-helix domain-containing protein [Actinospica sp. MGRD01-02]|uniref:Helix-turn-helix domain-containing protein n=1 Tax=Actinospica acidithermotolerans TaxID=2828514 RepID=A0A941IJJ0_9ACTN|nr:helix-turn-helix domain-containing protein [Actinospica acidithermotolerans]
MVDKSETWLLLGHSMRLLRERAGASLAAAAERVGASKSHLSLVERGRDRPSHVLVTRYDTCFGGDGMLSTMYLTARAPMIGGRPLPPGQTPLQLWPTEEPSGAAVGVHGERSSFIADVTPDGAVVERGAEITKTWRIRNDGGQPWVGMQLARVGPCDGPTVLASAPSVPIPRTEPGEVVDVSVPLRAPLVAGTSFAVWKMVDRDGCLVFRDLRHGLSTIVITVESAL